jgi:hypothetical protein
LPYDIECCAHGCDLVGIKKTTELKTYPEPALLSIQSFR